MDLRELSSVQALWYSRLETMAVGVLSMMTINCENPFISSPDPTQEHVNLQHKQQVLNSWPVKCRAQPSWLCFCARRLAPATSHGRLHLHLELKCDAQDSEIMEAFLCPGRVTSAIE